MPLKIIHDTTFETSLLRGNPVCNPLSRDNVDGLKQVRNKNQFRIIIGQVNINSVRNKFEYLLDLGSTNLDVLMIFKIKVDETFPRPQFVIKGFSGPYYFDNTVNSGGKTFLPNASKEL